MPLPAHLDRTPHMRAIAAGALLATALLTSITIMLTVTLGAAPKVAAQEPVTDEIQTMVSNVDARDVDDDTINVNLNGTAQVFRTGPQLGIRLDSIDVKFGTSVDKKYIVLNAGLHACERRREPRREAHRIFVRRQKEQPNEPVLGTRPSRTGTFNGVHVRNHVHRRLREQ